MAEGCNVLRSPAECVFKPFFEALLGATPKGQAGWQQLYEDWIFAPTAPSASNGLLLWSKPQSDPWVRLWEATWLGSGESVLLGLAILTLLLGYKVRKEGDIFGFTTTGGGQRMPEPSVKLGFMGILLAYPLSTLALRLANATAQLLFPGGRFPELMAAIFGKTVYESVNVLDLFASLEALVAVTVIGLGFITWKILLWAREFLVFVYIFLFPLILAGRYTGLPVIARFCQRLIRNYIKLLLIPFVPAVLAQVYLLVFGTSAAVSLIAPTVFMILLVWLTWTLFSSGAPVTATFMKGAVSGGLAAGVVAAGGSGFAASSMVRGRWASGALYTALPDFDHVSTNGQSPSTAHARPHPGPTHNASPAGTTASTTREQSSVEESSEPVVPALPAPSDKAAAARDKTGR